MSDRTHHSEWLSLIDVSGPFLAEPVLEEAFPQGLGALDSAKKTMLRQAYDEWREARDLDDLLLPKIHGAWIDLVLKQGLELDEQGKGDVLKPRSALPETLAYELPEHGVTLRPDYAVVDADHKPLMLIATYAPDISLIDARKGDAWAASPAERMVELCRATQARLGLLTNGEHWMFVDAPINTATTMANWYARLWGQEPRTLQAFVNLFGIRRFFVDRSEQLPALLDKSLEHQDEVTDALGEQVRRAVEVLIQALERADVDRKRELLEGIEPAELYEAGLTVMMRTVFLLSAEERGLLLMGDLGYEANYAVSTLRLQLRAESEEILERRWDAWSRLLCVFRAVYGGIDHESMRLPALGGSLFDPDRYPFLEGRTKGSSWRTDPATPLPIDNRTVLLLLEAVQLFQGRTLSYLALDVEQIGYVYEGLLERTAVRAVEVTLDLAATKNADNPWVSLPELDDAAAKGGKAVEELLKDRTGSSTNRVRNDLARQVDDAGAEKLLAACHGDRQLRDRIKPYFHFLRTDPWGYPLVYPKGTFMVMTDKGRRETGTHYTPKSFTEIIVSETLVPLVYVGACEGKPREDWRIKSAQELLEIKVCDPAMGSGAFLVQVCRWLSERLVEAWHDAEKEGYSISSDGQVPARGGVTEPLRPDPEERQITARRLISERCLYGVDVNPLAVELAKLSLWLVTLAKGRPFGYLDHNLKCGDSLLGLINLNQLLYLDMNFEAAKSKALFASNLEGAVDEATRLRSDLRRRRIVDIRDVEVMATLNDAAKASLRLPEYIADALMGGRLRTIGSKWSNVSLSIRAGAALSGDETAVAQLKAGSLSDLSFDIPEGKPERRPFHWPLEFPEVFTKGRNGFDAVVGNPPFRAGRYLTSDYGPSYRSYLQQPPFALAGQADLCAAFCARGLQLLNADGFGGFIATNTISEGDTRDAFIKPALKSSKLVYVDDEIRWPGKAQVAVSVFVISKSQNSIVPRHNGKEVAAIDATFSPVEEVLPDPNVLGSSRRLVGKGVGLGGDNFRLESADYPQLRSSDPIHVRRFITGTRHNAASDLWGGELVFWFEDIESEEAMGATTASSVFLSRLVGARQGKYWKYRRSGAKLYSFLQSCRYCIVRAQTSSTWCFSFMSSEDIFDQSMIVFGSNCAGLYSILHSSIHEAWVSKFSRSMKTDTGYSPSECFYNFPLPYDPLAATNNELSDVALEFSTAKLAIMNDMDIGNTKLWSMTNSSKTTKKEVAAVRELAERVDHAVAAAYGWTDLKLSRAFISTSDGEKLAISSDAESAIVHRLHRLNILQSVNAEAGVFAPREGRRGAGGG